MPFVCSTSWEASQDEELAAAVTSAADGARGEKATSENVLPRLATLRPPPLAAAGEPAQQPCEVAVELAPPPGRLLARVKLICSARNVELHALPLASGSQQRRSFLEYAAAGLVPDYLATLRLRDAPVAGSADVVDADGDGDVRAAEHELCPPRAVGGLSLRLLSLRDKTCCRFGLQLHFVEAAGPSGRGGERASEEGDGGGSLNSTSILRDLAAAKAALAGSRPAFGAGGGAGTAALSLMSQAAALGRQAPPTAAGPPPADPLPPPPSPHKPAAAESAAGANAPAASAPPAERGGAPLEAGFGSGLSSAAGLLLRTLGSAGRPEAEIAAALLRRLDGLEASIEAATQRIEAALSSGLASLERRVAALERLAGP